MKLQDLYEGIERLQIDDFSRLINLYNKAKHDMSQEENDMFNNQVKNYMDAQEAGDQQEMDMAMDYMQELLDYYPYIESVEQLDEGMLQSIFNFLWNATGNALDKMPVIGDKRAEARVKADYDHFVQTMTDERIDSWIAELTDKIKSEHPATARAVESRVKGLRARVKRVKDSKGPKDFRGRMYELRRNLQDFEKYTKTSNRRFMDTKRRNREKARAAKM